MATLQAPALSSRALSLGFVALTDAAPLIVAGALGLFARHGVRVALSPAASWAGLRDKVAFGALDAAHMLYPMPIAAALGLAGPPAALAVAAGLGRNGNTLVLSRAISGALAEEPLPLAAAAFAALVRARAAKGLPPLRLGVVHPVSSHNYLLREWLVSGGLNPDVDLAMSVLPPPAMPVALGTGALDGFCAGEPWGSAAVACGAGRIMLATGDIWPDHPEKVFAFRASVVEAEPAAAIAATAAVIAAARWLDEPANREEAAAILAQDAIPAVAPHIIAHGLAGRVPEPDGTVRALAHPLNFRAALAPHPAHAAFWLGCMRRCGHVPAGFDQAAALAPFRHDLFARAAQALGEPMHPPSPIPTEFAA
ncbi:CmpA/NrtA family ABC transporter substrate-binding protein [Humitalea sp. 24SJ18S-53]|uniref:CmpA/NrtA family ABC transporter substrate-binding protein n=1 Tax=Humitalea sp. 24SJ18S-53 TaxID=3422307 RepID=UPI003D67A195